MIENLDIVNENIASLSNEMVISVFGSMNVGKSTFIN